MSTPNTDTWPAWAETAFGPIGGHVRITPRSEKSPLVGGTLIDAVLTDDDPSLGWLVVDHGEVTAIALDDIAMLTRAKPTDGAEQEEWGREVQAGALPLHLGSRVRVPTGDGYAEGELLSVGPVAGGSLVVLGMDGGASHRFQLADDTPVRVR